MATAPGGGPLPATTDAMEVDPPCASADDKVSAARVSPRSAQASATWGCLGASSFLGLLTLSMRFREGGGGRGDTRRAAGPKGRETRRRRHPKGVDARRRQLPNGERQGDGGPAPAS
jgi:hypothetical protein